MIRAIPQGKAFAAGDAGYCGQCQASLAGCEGKCDECGRAFDPDDPRTYRQRQVFLSWSFWFPGFCLAVASGILSYGFCLTNGSDLGFGLFVGVPVSVGAILGYSTRVSAFVTLPLWGLSLPAVVLGLLMLNLTGLYIGMVLTGVFALPTLFGIAAGGAARGAGRHHLASTAFSAGDCIGGILARGLFTAE